MTSHITEIAQIFRFKKGFGVTSALLHPKWATNRVKQCILAVALFKGHRYRGHLVSAPANSRHSDEDGDAEDNGIHLENMIGKPPAEALAVADDVLSLRRRRRSCTAVR